MEINYVTYTDDSSETRLSQMMSMIQDELSEPYSIFTYRFFLSNWPHLTYLVLGDTCVGVIIGKVEQHRTKNRGYIAMLVVKKDQRGKGIGKKLVQLFIEAAVEKDKADEIVLETEAVNRASLSLYAKLGFAKDKRLLNYYMNGNDAFRLKLWLKDNQVEKEKGNEEVKGN